MAMQMQQQRLQSRCSSRLAAANRPRALRAVAQTTSTTSEVKQAVGTRMVIKEHGSYSLQGTVRKINEDRFSIQVGSPSWKPGEAVAFAGVYDGHGGYAVADWLENKLMSVVQQHWAAKAPEQSMTDAFLAADSTLLSAKKGFMGMGERGVGGSKCGATAAVAMVYVDPTDANQTKLVTANIGDARTVLVRGGQAIQLSIDHVPDDEYERERIERFNPNPKMPLVRYQGGTWRVGGLLALSRAFGDAYLKGSLQFEGIPEGSDGYSSGFGVIAEPHTTVDTLTDEDSWLVVASDGLYAEEERGGGGGLDNATMVKMLQSAGNTSCNKLAEQLATKAVEVGSTDDVTVVVMRLGRA